MIHNNNNNDGPSIGMGGLEVVAHDQPDARYLYCVAETDGISIPFVMKGIDESQVYTVHCQDIVVLTHNCKPQPYNSGAEQQTLDWILCHEKVIEEAMSYYSNVLPFAFNTIIKGRPGDLTTTDSLLRWIGDNYALLKSKLNAVRGKREYIIKAFLDCRVAASRLMATDSELMKLKEAVGTSSRGKAFFFKEKMQTLLKQKVADHADKLFHDIYTNITQTVPEYRVEKIAPAEKDQLMLLNISCLADKVESEKLGEILNKTNCYPAVTVSFSGPWPPYSFMR